MLSVTRTCYCRHTALTFHTRSPQLIPGTRDVVATRILGMMRPELIRTHIPLQVAGDGNCLLRAISRALYGTEVHHTFLRLKTALEILTWPQLYDDTRSDYDDILNDTRLVLPSYRDTVRMACSEGAYTDIIHMYAVSAVIRAPILSVHPSDSAHLARRGHYVRRFQA